MYRITIIITAFFSICLLLFSPLRPQNGADSNDSNEFLTPRLAIPHNFGEDGPLGKWPDFTPIGFITAPILIILILRHTCTATGEVSSVKSSFFSRVA